MYSAAGRMPACLSSWAIEAADAKGRRAITKISAFSFHKALTKYEAANNVGRTLCVVTKIDVTMATGFYCFDKLMAWRERDGDRKREKQCCVKPLS
jgi:hypothetical protein